jgi:hypothetical protein
MRPETAVVSGGAEAPQHADCARPTRGWSRVYSVLKLARLAARQHIRRSGQPSQSAGNDYTPPNLVFAALGLVLGLGTIIVILARPG